MIVNSPAIMFYTFRLQNLKQVGTKIVNSYLKCSVFVISLFPICFIFGHLLFVMIVKTNTSNSHFPLALVLQKFGSVN